MSLSHVGGLTSARGVALELRRARARLADAVELWERAAVGIEERENLLVELREFERVASDPLRHFAHIARATSADGDVTAADGTNASRYAASVASSRASSATTQRASTSDGHIGRGGSSTGGGGGNRLAEERTRRRLDAKITAVSSELNQTLDLLSNRHGDIVPCAGVPDYRVKMMHDRRDVMLQLEQDRSRERAAGGATGRGSATTTTASTTHSASVEGSLTNFNNTVREGERYGYVMLPPISASATFVGSTASAAAQ